MKWNVRILATIANSKRPLWCSIKLWIVEIFLVCLFIATLRYLVTGIPNYCTCLYLCSARVYLYSVSFKADYAFVMKDKPSYFRWLSLSLRFEGACHRTSPAVPTAARLLSLRWSLLLLLLLSAAWPHCQCSSDHDRNRRCFFLFQGLQFRRLRTSLRLSGRAHRAHRG